MNEKPKKNDLLKLGKSKYIVVSEVVGNNIITTEGESIENTLLPEIELLYEGVDKEGYQYLQEVRKLMLGVRSHIEKIGGEVDTSDFVNFEKFLNTLFEKTDYFVAPASAKYHLCCKHGLAIHSISVFNTARKLNDILELRFRLWSILKCSIVHDLCKADTYIVNRNKDGSIHKSQPYKRKSEYATGHSDISIFKALKYGLVLNVEEINLIRCHMGMFDEEVRNNIRNITKNTPRALFLSFADWMSTLYKED